MMNFLRFIILILTILSPTFGNSDSKKYPTVKVPGFGKIRGVFQKTALTNKKYPSFLGIPYGKIPQRFTPSIELKRLNDGNNAFDATQLQKPCIQPPNDLVKGTENSGVEDCLTLNIFTPNTNPGPGRLYPVVFFIHGGSFYRWSGNLWTGDRLLERDVVLVAINYRLGPLGFFCLGTDDAPGNSGLYDQITALKWVKSNIKYFGGDPSKVTIAGQSAGAGSVTWLLDSPLARGLFRSAIALSGADVDSWARQFTPISNSLTGAKALGCYTTKPNSEEVDNDAIISCLRKLPAKDFNAALTAGFYTAPSVQDFELNIPKSSPTSPIESVTRGLQNPVPLIIGTTKNEGSFLVSRLFTTIHGAGVDENPEFLKTKLIPSILTTYGLKDEPPGNFDKISKTYLGDTAESGNFSVMIPGLIDMYTALYFNEGSQLIADYHSLLNPNTYLYSFEYFGNISYFKYQGGVPEIPRGVAHTDDLLYILTDSNLATPDDLAMSKLLVNSWANFATTGDPNIGYMKEEPLVTVWPKRNFETHEYAKIDVVPSIGRNFEATWAGAAKNIRS